MNAEEQSDSLEGAQIMLSYDEENPEADMSVIDSGTLGLRNSPDSRPH